MKQALTAQQAKKIDQYTIEQGLPSLVLMERAALSVVEFIKCELEHHKKDCNCKEYSNIDANIFTETGRLSRNECKSKIIAVCGTGNNGADGLAVSRMLVQEGYLCDVLIIGDEKNFTPECELQKSLAEKAGVKFIHQTDFAEYNIIIDSIFGVGLSRAITGKYKDIVDKINASGKYIIAVDISSGIDASNGKVLGVAIKADCTITFGYAKIGHLMFPGKEYSGELIVKNIGFFEDAYVTKLAADYFDNTYKKYIPARKPRTNKGDYGRVLIIAGSKDMTGAAYLSAMAAYRSGAGVVTVLTHETAATYLKLMLPEAIIKAYNDENAEQRALENISKASVIVLGPGISVSDTSQKLVEAVLLNAKVPVIVDADALNVVAAGNDVLLQNNPGVRIITPHIGEMMRLTKADKAEVVNEMFAIASDYSQNNNLICVLKDAVSIVTTPNGRRYINTSGNPGMATAGSGDVLTGIMAAIMSLQNFDNMNEDEAVYCKVCLAVYIHGLAGDYARNKMGENSMLARDIIDALSVIL